LIVEVFSTASKEDVTKGLESTFKEVVETTPEPPNELKRLTLSSVIKFFGLGAIIASVGIGSGELIWAPRAAAAFGYIMTWTFFYGVWTKAVIQYLLMKWFTLTGEPPSHAMRRVIGGWFVVLLAFLFVAVTPWWFVALGRLSAQIVINAFGLPMAMEMPTYIAIMLVTLGIIVGSAYIGKAVKVLEWVQTAILLVMIVLFWIAVGVATRPDWGAFFAYMFVPIVPPGYEPWVKEVAPDIARVPVMWFILPALGALGAGIHEYIGYAAIFDEKGWGAPASPKWQSFRKLLYDIPRAVKIPLPSGDSGKSKLMIWRRASILTVLIGFIALWITTVPAIVLSIEVLRPRHLLPDGIKLTAAQAEWLRVIHPSLTFMWWLGAFVAMWGTFYGIWEVYVWTLHDFLRSFKRFANLERSTVRKFLWPYYLVMATAIYFLGFSIPYLASFASAVLNVFSTGLVGLAFVYLELTQLPKEYRAPWWYLIFTVGGGLLYAFWGLVNIAQAFGISPY